MHPLHYRSITEIRQALNSHEISARQLMDALITRSEALDDRVGAFLHRDFADARAQADASDARRRDGKTLGPLDGIPVSIKDVLAVAGQPLTCGSRMLENYVSPYDAGCISRLKHQGAILWGRLNMDEFAMGSATENSAFQKTRNPWNLNHTPGGSSGGSAAAVAAGETIAALGTDTGGSVRQPAAFCGIVGFKPTYGRVSRHGLVAYASSLDQVGTCTRTIADAALLLNAICGHDPLDSTSLDLPIPDLTAALFEKNSQPRKIGIARELFGAGLDPEIKACLDSAIHFYKSHGCEIIDVSLPHISLSVPVYYLIATAEASSNLARFDGVRYTHRSESATDAINLFSKSRAEGFGAEVKRRILLGTFVLSSGYYDAYYLRAQKIRTLIRRDFENAFKNVDAILSPTTSTAALPLGHNSEDPLAVYLSDLHTIPVNLAGLPAVSLPCGFTNDGLPVGMQLIGKALDENTILQLAQSFECAHDFNRQTPSL
jgi:aspartyl-tRNA(Asn)/glutamyl-tRNA(Gln) amidotransferase subunit A